MKLLSIFLLLMLVSVPAFSSNNPFSHFVGCYETLEVDRRALPPPDENNLIMHTKIQEEYAWVVLDLNGSKIPAVSALLYEGLKDDGAYHFEPAEVFLDRGTFLEDKDVAYYSFEGKLRYAFQPDLIFTLRTKISIRTVDQDRILFHVKRTVDETNDFNIDSVFLLKKAQCQK